jgi:hypothetical protein
VAVPAELEKISLMRAGCPDTPLCVDLDSLLPAAAAPHSHLSPPAAIEPHLLESFAEHVDCFFAASCIQVPQHTHTKRNVKPQYMPACIACKYQGARSLPLCHAADQTATHLCPPNHSYFRQTWDVTLWGGITLLGRGGGGCLIDGQLGSYV